MSMSNEQRLTAEEFRDAVMAEFENKKQPASSFYLAVSAICEDELDHRDELATLDLDCESCKL